VNNLPKVVAQQHRGRASNPRLLDRKSDALPLSHRATPLEIEAEEEKYLILNLARNRASLNHRPNDAGNGLNATVFLGTLRQSQGPMKSRLYLDSEHRLSVWTMIACSNASYQNTTERRRVFVSNVLARRQQVIQQKRQYTTFLRTNSQAHINTSPHHIQNKSNSNAKNRYSIFACS